MLDLIFITLFQAAAGDPAVAEAAPEPTAEATAEATEASEAPAARERDTGETLIPGERLRCRPSTGSRLRARDTCRAQTDRRQRQVDEADYDRQTSGQRDDLAIIRTDGPFSGPPPNPPR